MELMPRNANGQHPPEPSQQDENHESVGNRQRKCKLSWTTIAISILGGIVIVGCIVGAAVYFSDRHKSNAANNTNSGFVGLGVYYGKSLNQSAEPCGDFYEFTCSNLRIEYQKENNSFIETLDIMSKHVPSFLDDFLTKPVDTSDSATLSQLKTFQQICIDKAKVEAEAIEPILHVLKEIGGWPFLVNDWNVTESWEQIVGSINVAGFATMFPYYMRPGTTLSLEPVLHSTRPRVLPDGQRTVDYVKNVTSLLNTKNDRIVDDIKDCIAFECKLQQITDSTGQDVKGYTLESLGTEHPEIAWKFFFRNAFVSTPIEVTSDQTVVIRNSQYQQRISELLNKTSTKIVRNYLVWRLINRAIPIMPDTFREAKNVFQQRAIEKSRNKDCVAILMDNAKVSMGFLYVSNNFDDVARNKSDGIMRNLKNQADRFLKHNTWMDVASKIAINETLSKLKMVVSGPNNTVDLLENFSFETNDTVFSNYRRLAKSHRYSRYGRLEVTRSQDNQLIPYQYATKADAFYYPFQNAMYIIAAMFQRPVFSVDQPMYLNYGGIGFIIAHEMTHALDILSHCNNATCPSYNQTQGRKKCMEKLYDGYEVEQLKEKVNGRQTVGENIGDLIGLKLAYRAYEDYIKDSKEPVLPGFSYTARQWFWINAATFFCSYETDASLRNRIATDEHSPHEARVNVAFANVEEFAKDFACPSDSRMNPADRCEFL